MTAVTNITTEACQCWRHATPLGEMVLAAEGEHLIGAWFVGQKHYASTLRNRAVCWQRTAAIDAAICWLDAYFAGKRPSWLPKLRLIGTPWQTAVWQHLQRIAYSETITYGAIAQAIAAESGRRVSAQAVGNAVGSNPLSLFVPCHRVIGYDGSLTGYAAGIDIKQALLKLEQQ